MFVIFDREDKKGFAMKCFHKNLKEQEEMMHRLDIDEQVKDWQESNSGNPPRFYSKIEIREFIKDIDIKQLLF